MERRLGAYILTDNRLDGMRLPVGLADPLMAAMMAGLTLGAVEEEGGKERGVMLLAVAATRGVEDEDS